MENQHSEVAVVGGGMVGAALALGLAQQGFQVTVIEQAAPVAVALEGPPDVRVSAISSASVALLKELGVWQTVLGKRCHPYRQLETWEWESAHVVFNADELALPELGYMVENRVLQTVLWDALVAHHNITLRCLAMLTRMEEKDGRHWLHFTDGAPLVARMVMGADGANSMIRAWSGIGLHGWEYAQSCMLITVACDFAPGDATWQAFTPDGPRAFLPLYDNWASLVWYDTPSRIRQLQSLPLEQLQEAISRHFPARLGNVTPVARGSFPLVRRHALQYVQPGLALVGDAAHTIHPLAGQGVNLGYRDVDALIAVLVQSRSNGEDWWSLPVLKRYQRRRLPDNLLMQSGMDMFYAGFSNDKGPLKVVRNLGLMAASKAGVLKRRALKYALGL